LVHQRSQLLGVNPPAWRDKPGSNFDDQSHELV
jgi:hypothetical protein